MPRSNAEIVATMQRHPSVRDTRQQLYTNDEIDDADRILSNLGVTPRIAVHTATYATTRTGGSRYAVNCLGVTMDRDVVDVTWAVAVICNLPFKSGHISFTYQMPVTHGHPDLSLASLVDGISFYRIF